MLIRHKKWSLLMPMVAIGCIYCWFVWLCSKVSIVSFTNTFFSTEQFTVELFKVFKDVAFVIYKMFFSKITTIKINFSSKFSGTCPNMTAFFIWLKREDFIRFQSFVSLYHLRVRLLSINCLSVRYNWKPADQWYLNTKERYLKCQLIISWVSTEHQLFISWSWADKQFSTNWKSAEYQLNISWIQEYQLTINWVTLFANH